ncbi:protein of unknown function [Paraburkholderia dioscoreae]|uniref:Uncharacterized protein n=1 Tax=Paraburkholderia dioscoreae TaxID=2604047 RepID=A0A5Q4YYM7_9BURK|nr:protein of unknown function [Paraburkholderia dioscoreae]
MQRHCIALSRNPKTDACQGGCYTTLSNQFQIYEKGGPIRLFALGIPSRRLAAYTGKR